MLLDAIGKMLPAMMAIVLTPIQVIAVVLVLGGRNGRAGGPAFLIGWLAALSVLTWLAYLLVDLVGDGTPSSSAVVHWLQLVLGLLLLWAALRLWRTRPKEGEDVTPPAMLASIGDSSTPRALMWGVLICVSNPKIVALVLAGMSSLAYLPLTPPQATVAGGMFVLLASLPVIILVVAHAFGGEAMSGRFDSLKAFLLRHSNVIVMVVLAILGVHVFGNGISGLAVRFF